MLFSLIIPVYKVEKYLRQCVDSVLTQSFTDFEIILVDDGSPDSSPDICDEYAARDSRIKVIHKQNGGLSDARNFGLDNATGEYVIFLDSDDWWSDECALEKISKRINDTNPTILIFGMKKYYTLDNRFGDTRIPVVADNTLNGDYLIPIMQSNAYVACAWDKVVKREFIEKERLRFVKGQLSEDIEWCCKLLLRRPSIEILQEAIYVYRQQVSTSITVNIGTKNIRSILDVIKKYAVNGADTPLMHFLANQYVLLITNLMRLSKKEGSQFDKEIRAYWWLLKFNWYPYVQKVSRIKILGYDSVKLILMLYYKSVR